MTTRLLSLALVGLVASGCSCGGPEGDPDTGPPDMDAGTPIDGGGVDGGPDASPCPPGRVLRFDECVPDPPSCAMGEECQNDSCCVAGECIPFGVSACGDFDEMCEAGDAPGGFAPHIECEWTGGAGSDRGIMANAVVGDMDMDGDGTTIHPSIAWFSLGGGLFMIDGATCTEQFFHTGEGYNSAGTPAFADIDGDGRADLIAGGSNVKVFTWDLTSGSLVEMWTGHRADGSVGPGGRNLAIHDLDDDGRPEIIASGVVYDSTGLLLIDTGVSTNSPTLADIDADGTPELITTNGIYEADLIGGAWVAETYWTTPSASRRWLAVADFGDFGDGPDAGEVVFVGDASVFITRMTGEIVVGPFAMPGRLGGPPTVADFDGDGEPEVGVAGSSAYSVFDLECDVTPLPSFCFAAGMRWQQPSQDASSGQTGSSVFDFEGDGSAEAVYADECFMRVYDGATGMVKFSAPRSSNTIYEYPVIADVDGDFNSEIVVGRNLIAYSSNCTDAHDPLFTGAACDPIDTPCASPLHECVAGVCRAPREGGQGLRVYGDLADTWVNSRPIWNQYDYHVTHVLDDGTIPSTSSWMVNWSVPRLNNFRQNNQGILGDIPAPDLTIRPNDGWDCSGNATQTFEVSVCNRGSEPVSPGVPVTFEAMGMSICEFSRTTMILRPGECEDISCTWDRAPTEPVDVTVIADDDEAGFGTPYRECREDNNRAIFSENSCDLI